MKELKLIFLLVATLVFGIAKADLQADAANAYSRGEYKRAAILLESLAEKGDVKSQGMLGTMYSQGIGVQKNILEAMRWLSLAAHQNSHHAQTELGSIFMREEGFQNYKKAYELFLLAAEQTNARAMFGLGFLYAKGWGVPSDLVRAYMWFNLLMLFSTVAEEYGLTQDAINKAKEIRATLTEVMSSDQINEAQDLSMSCVRKKLKNC